MKLNLIKALNKLLKFSQKTLLNFGLLGVCFGALYVVNAQNIRSIKESAKKLEVQAEKISYQWNSESIRQYIDLYTQAADLWEKSNDKEQASNCLRQIARYQSLFGNTQKTLESLRKALELEKSSQYIEGQIQTLSLLSDIYLKTDDKKKSEVFFKESLQLSNQTNDSLSKAISANSAAEYYYFERDFSKASIFYKQSLTNWEKTDNKVEHAKTLVNYGYFLIGINESLKGLKMLKQAEEYFQNVNSKRGLALTYIAMGHLYSIIDKKQTALDFYRLAIDGFPEDVDLIERARIYNGFGLVYEDLRKWKLSLDYRKKALKLYKQVYYLQGQMATLPSLVKLNYIIKNKSQAERYYSELKSVSNQLKDKFFLAITQKQIGDYYFDNKLDDKALMHYEKTLRVLNVYNSKIDLALIQNNLGTIYKRKEKHDIARKYYNSSLKISREVSDKFTEANILHNIAKLDIVEDKLEEALHSIKDSVNLTEEISSDIFNPNATRKYFTNAYARYEVYISLLISMHRRFPERGFDIEALQAREKSRSRSILRKLQLIEISPETIQEEAEIRNLLNLKKEARTKNLQDSSSKEKLASLDKEIFELTNQLEDIKALLKVESPIYSSIPAHSKFDLSEFQENILDENTLLVEFYFGEKESYVWVVSKNDLEVYTIPNRKILNSHIDNLLQLLIPSEAKKNEEIEVYQKRITDSEKKYWKESQDLSNKIFGNLINKLGEKRLIIVPDGKLQYFPISALPTPNQGQNVIINKPFLLKNEIVYEPSASALNILRKLSNNSKLAKKDFLVLADPIFSKYDDRFSQIDRNKISDKQLDQTKSVWKKFRSINNLDSLQRLESSKAESETILQNFESKNSTVVLGFSANRKNFLDTSISDYNVIHFATHGLLNEEEPELSGIILSQYNKHGKKLEGLIWLKDIYGLNLSADLVVLSACDTGIGKEIKGEGLMSLTNGFLQSGAKTVISSRWKVDDYATYELMKYFYDFLADERITPSQALRKAKIKMYENPKFKSPFYWSAFTTHGDFQNRPKISPRFKYLNYYTLIAILFLAFGIYRGYIFFK